MFGKTTENDGCRLGLENSSFTQDPHFTSKILHIKQLQCHYYSKKKKKASNTHTAPAASKNEGSFLKPRCRFPDPLYGFMTSVKGP